MKFLGFVLSIGILASAAHAENAFVNITSSFAGTGFESCEDQDRRPDHRPDRRPDDRPDRRPDDRRPRERVSSQCSLPTSSCGSSSGSRGTLNACSIVCYDNASAICSPGSFGGVEDCDVQSDNECYCN